MTGKFGGRTRTSGQGRPKGAVNKATVDVKLAAQAYTQEALETLAEIMRDKAQAGAARVSAANAIMDRGHGKAMQPHQHELSLVDLTDEQIAALDSAFASATNSRPGVGRDRETPSLN